MGSSWSNSTQESPEQERTTYALDRLLQETSTVLYPNDARSVDPSHAQQQQECSMSISRNEILIKELDRKKLEEWYNHLTQVFGNQSRDYFINHYENDPYKDRKSIKVAVHNGKIISTVCVFPRWLYLRPRSPSSNTSNNLVVPCGGLGEVSTHNAYRKQGIVKRLIQEAVLDMKDKGMKICILFTSPETAHLYKQSGWKPKRREYIVERIQNFPLKDKDIKRVITATIRKPRYDDPRELDRLIQLYRGYARRFNGMVVRDHRDYWKNWIAYATEDPHAHSVTLVLCNPDNSDMIEAYLSVALRKKGDSVVLKVQDFFVMDTFYNQDKGRGAFEELIRGAWNEFHSPSIGCKWPTDMDANTRNKVHKHREELVQQVKSVVYPAPLFPRTSLPSSGCDSMTDESLMYRMMDDGDVVGDAAHANLAECMKLEDFVYWDVDCF